MKNIILFVFLLINFYSYSQKLDEGRYCTTPIGESDVICIDILNNNHFKYVHSGCLGIQEFGTGKYEIKKQNLILHFDNTKAKKLQRATIINSINQNKDSVTLKFNVKDTYNLPIYGVNIFTDKSFKKRKDWLTDRKGDLIIKKVKNKLAEKYHFSYIGFEQFTITISNNTDKNIDITLYDLQPKRISNIKKYFFVEEDSKNKNLLRIPNFKKTLNPKQE